MPYSLEPQVAGEFGRRTRLDPSVHPPIVSRLDFVLDYPDAEDLIERFPIFMVNKELAERMEREGLTGFSFAAAKVRPSRNYKETYGRAPHRKYRWLQPTGSPRDDVWIAGSLRLCVSDRMMRVLEDFDISTCLGSDLPTR